MDRLLVGSMAFCVLIRVDCGKEIGLGHAMRCLALAHALKEHGATVDFASATCMPGFAARLESYGFRLHKINSRGGSTDDAVETADYADKNSADLVILDGYAFTSNFQQTVRAPGWRVMVVDDNGELAPFESDIVLNHNPQSKLDDYAERGLPPLNMIGARYTMLRPEFKTFSSWKRDTGEALRLLVAIGGTDAGGLTSHVLDVINNLDGPALDVIVAGPSAEAATGSAGIHKIQFAGEIENMAEAMARADAAIIGAGSMLWEAAFMGLPCIALIVADNQANGADYFAAKRCGHVLDARSELNDMEMRRSLSALIADPMRRQAFAENGRKLIDGRGAERVAAALIPAVAEASDI